MTSLPVVVVLGVVAVAVVLSLLWRWNIRPVVIRVPAVPDLPSRGFDHEPWERLLARFLDTGGRVDYQSWISDPIAVAELDRYLAALAAVSPDSAPERFPEPGDRLQYWVQAYNAFVIKGVLRHWPLESVRDVKAPVEVASGLGFFYTLRFVAGGVPLSLYQIEHRKVLGNGNDPRAHFVLNCGSTSCPALRPSLPAGDALEDALAAAAADFVSDPRNVCVDHGARSVRLSPIFRMYERDFVGELKRRGLPSAGGALAYVRTVAPATLRDELDLAAGYRVEYGKFDWSVNATVAS